MLRISKKVEYALMALQYMALRRPQGQERPEGDLFSTREICDEFNVPFDTLAKVMQLLCNERILKSSHGVKGGYSLIKDLSLISYYDLNVIIEGKSFGDYCNGPRAVCDQFSQCHIIHPLHTLNEHLIEFFKGVKLKDLLMENKANLKTFQV